MNTTQKRPWYGTVLSILLGFNTIMVLLLFVLMLWTYMTFGEPLKSLIPYVIPSEALAVTDLHAIAAQWASMLLPYIVAMGIAFVIDAVLTWGTWVGHKWAPIIVTVCSAIGFLGGIWSLVEIFTTGAFYPSGTEVAAHLSLFIVQLFVLTLAILCMKHSYYTSHKPTQKSA